MREAGVEALVKDIRAFARYFCAMALGREQDADAQTAFHDLRELKVDVAYPFLLELYHDYASGTLSAADFVAAVRLVEAYVFRRAICAIPTNSMNKTFATFAKALKKDRYLESIQAHFLTLPSYRRFPERRGVPPRSADPRSLQLPKPQLLAPAAGEPRPQGARAGGRVHHRAHPAAEPEPLGGMEAGPRRRNGSACSSNGCTHSATSR